MKLIDLILRKTDNLFVQFFRYFGVSGTCLLVDTGKTPIKSEDPELEWSGRSVLTIPPQSRKIRSAPGSVGTMSGIWVFPTACGS